MAILMIELAVKLDKVLHLGNKGKDIFIATFAFGFERFFLVKTTAWEFIFST